MSISFSVSADTVETIEELLTPLYYPIPNQAAALMQPPDILGWQTPIQAHSVFALFTVGRELFAACSPQRLSFFGTKDPIESSLCEQPNFAKTHMLAAYYIMQLAYEDQSHRLRTFLLSISIDPDMNRDDRTTTQGWAYWISHRFFEKYLANDGWNMLGNIRSNVKGYRNGVQITGRYPRRYADTTNYRPSNPPHIAPEKLRFPLRWQPLTEHIDGYGDFSSQVHVTTYIGRTVKPLTMDMQVWKTLKTYAPYRNPSSQKRISARDYRKLTKHMIPNMLKEMKLVHTRGMENKIQKLFRAKWWDTKFASLGYILPFYDNHFDISPGDIFISKFGENIAVHDAAVLAWREKVKHDLGRPGPILRRLLMGQNVTVDGDVSVPVEEWQPTVRTMPHSEFPSGSAVVCAAVVEYVRRYCEYRSGGNFSNPGMTYEHRKGVYPNLPDIDISFHYKTFDEIVDDCGMSRVWSGLHFKPAIREGERVGRIVGQRAFETWRDLEEGRIPKHCHWCLS